MPKTPTSFNSDVDEVFPQQQNSTSSASWFSWEPVRSNTCPCCGGDYDHEAFQRTCGLTHAQIEALQVPDFSYVSVKHLYQKSVYQNGVTSRLSSIKFAFISNGLPPTNVESQANCGQLFRRSEKTIGHGWAPS